MFKINRLRVEILTNGSSGIDDLYGFDFTFQDGLNVIAGQNSKGKTTINSCIYYALGMEELLGGHNEKALDKSLKEQFSIRAGDTGDELITLRVVDSKVLMEIENDAGRLASLERVIHSSNKEIRSSNIVIYESRLDDRSDPSIRKNIYYVNSRGNNDDPNGFYKWFSSFIGITIPLVSNGSATSGYSPLYLQTIFSAIFIEQTKGWSDFLATMPFFGIIKAKEKIIEFLIGLNEIETSTKRDVLLKKKDSITSDWKIISKQFVYSDRYPNSRISDLPDTPITDRTAIDRINLLFTTSDDEVMTLERLLTKKAEDLANLEIKPLATIKETREKSVSQFVSEQLDYQKMKEHIDLFSEKLGIEKRQLESLLRQLDIVNGEIRDHVNLQKVFSESIINENGTNHCPTCTQEVSTDLISTKNITIPKLTLEENTNFLKSQKKIIDSSINSLKKVIEEKDRLFLYYQNALRQKELMIKSLSADLITDDRAFSRSEFMEKVQLEREIADLENSKIDLSSIKSKLIELAIKLHNINIDIEALGDPEEEDEKKLTSFEKLYKALLTKFGYDSNDPKMISVNRKEPFKYFPVYQNTYGYSLPQSIRINSSASDFVRNIWAYTLALLMDGHNHPGLIIFDEPGQHRTSLDSLKELFTSCYDLSTKQTIIFTSIDKKINEEGEKIDLSFLIDELDVSKYNLIDISVNYKVINKLVSSN